MWFLRPLAFVAFVFTVLTSAMASPPVPSTNKGNAFSVPLSHNVQSRRHGPSEVLRTLKKYKLDIPDGLQETVDKHHAKMNLLAEPSGDGTGNVPANAKDGDLLWLAPISIGTPPQQLFMDIDTGSTDSWVFSTDTEKSEVNGQTLWDPSKSSTAALIPNCNWTILYGDWSTSSGKCYQDTFMLGNLSISNMTIESATSVSSMFSATSYMSGLVGLAWPDLKQTMPPQKSLIEFLPDVLDSPVFTVDFRHNSSDGSFNFGYIDHALHESDIVYTNVDTSSGFWTVTNTGFGISGDNITYSYTTPKDVIMDTGTTLLFGPSAAVDTYFSKVPGAVFSLDDFGYVVPCSAELPDFMWEISDEKGNIVQGVIPGPYLIYAHTTDEMCFAGLQAVSGFTGVQGIFGDIFLKSGFFVFDMKEKRFGAATKPLNLDNGKRHRSKFAGVDKRNLEVLYV